jgi:hypothetical protein
LAEKSAAWEHFFEIRKRGVSLNFFDQIRLSGSLLFALHYDISSRL